MKRKATLGILLVLLGLFGLFHSVGNHIWEYIEQQSGRTSQDAESVDENIEEYIGKYKEKLLYLVENEAFTEKQRIWRETGEIEELAVYLKQDILLHEKQVVDFVVRKNDDILLSQKEIYDYSFEKIEGTSTIEFCKSNDDSYNLAILYKADHDINYILLLDMKEFHKYVTNEKGSRPDDIFLFNKSHNCLICSQHKRVYIGNIEQGKHIGKSECIEALVNENQNQGIIAYRMNGSDKEERRFVYNLPAENTGNGIFSIGVSVIYSETINSIQRMVVVVLISGFVVVLGIALIINVSIGAWKANKKRKQEIQRLYKKNEEMEKQNQEMQSLAHRQRLETIGILTSGIAHEFNNLLTPIMGYSMMTLEQLSEENEEICENVIEIYNASRKARDIISRLSNLSRKKDTITYSKVSIDKTIENALDVIKSVQPKMITVERKLNCDGVTISGNETLLMQMILNLVMNSFQAMEKEGGVLTITTGVEREQVKVSIEDTGPGIKEEIRGKIFEPFFTTKQSTKGTGLGLSIVWQIVDSHQGKIEVKGKEGEGCIFVVYLPLDEEAITQ